MLPIILQSLEVRELSKHRWTSPFNHVICAHDTGARSLFELECFHIKKRGTDKGAPLSQTICLGISCRNRGSRQGSHWRPVPEPDHYRSSDPGLLDQVHWRANRGHRHESWPLQGWLRTCHPKCHRRVRRQYSDTWCRDFYDSVALRENSVLPTTSVGKKQRGLQPNKISRPQVTCETANIPASSALK